MQRSLRQMILPYCPSEQDFSTTFLNCRPQQDFRHARGRRHWLLKPGTKKKKWIPGAGKRKINSSTTGIFLYRHRPLTSPQSRHTLRAHRPIHTTWDGLGYIHESDGNNRRHKRGQGVKKNRTSQPAPKNKGTE